MTGAESRLCWGVEWECWLKGKGAPLVVISNRDGLTQSDLRSSVGLGGPDAKEAAYNRMILAIGQARNGSKKPSWPYYILDRNNLT